MTSILLYSASISQSGTTTPSTTDGSKGIAKTSGSWARLDTGSYKFTRTSGLYFYPTSGSTSGALTISTLTPSSTGTCSFSCFFSGSDSSSFYLTTFSSNNSLQLVDNVLSGSGIQLDISIVY